MQNELTGTIKALLLQYKKAIDELIAVINPLNSGEIMAIRDDKTTDLNCTSIQTVLTHVVYAGYGYTTFIENHLGANKQRKPKQHFENASQYIEELNSMFRYCEIFFIEHPQVELEAHDCSKQIVTHWGQLFDIEQMMEHAIVHVLKHRAQIERFKKIGDSQKLSDVIS